MIRRAAATGSVLLASCSLVVDDLPLHCAEQSDCDALNAAEGLELARDCVVYQCRNDKRGCEKRAQDVDGDGFTPVACHDAPSEDIDCDDSFETGKQRAPKHAEDCDGIDNDCDGLVDDGVFAAAAPRAPANPLIGARNVVHLSHARRGQGRSYLALTSEQGRAFTTSIWQYDDPFDPERTFSGADVAIGADGDCGVAGSCKLSELVLAAQPDILLTLGINHAGCGLGEARAAAGGSNFTPDKGSLVWATSLSHSDCVPDATVGASHASLALLEPPKGPPQGLALWRAGSDAAHTSAPLAGNGLWIDARGTAPPKLRGTNGDVAEQVASSEGRDAAASVAWYGHEQAGYFVAYDTPHAVELAFVPALTDANAPAMDGWSTASLEEDAPGHVALAIGASSADSEQPSGLAAAWRTERGEIRFVRISFDHARMALMAGARETLRSAATIVEGPVIVYLPEGLSERASAREAGTGGWFVAWVEGTATTHRMVGVRVSEASTERELPFLIFEGQRLAHLFAYRADDTTPGYGFIDAEADTQQLYIGSLKCSTND